MFDWLLPSREPECLLMLVLFPLAVAMRAPARRGTFPCDCRLCNHSAGGWLFLDVSWSRLLAPPSSDPSHSPLAIRVPPFSVPFGIGSEKLLCEHLSRVCGTGWRVCAGGRTSSQFATDPADSYPPVMPCPFTPCDPCATAATVHFGIGETNLLACALSLVCLGLWLACSCRECWWKQVVGGCRTPRVHAVEPSRGRAWVVRARVLELRPPFT